MGRPVPPHVVEIERAHPGMRLCYRCDELSPTDNFGTKDSGARAGRECKSCRSKRALAMTHEQRVRNLWHQAKARARRFSLPFTLLTEDITVPDMCPVLGLEIHWGSSKQRDHSPSLDRLIPELGYTKENVLVVSWLANNIRGKFTSEQLRKVSDFYAEIIPAAS